MGAARFEVVRTDATQPWHGRFVAGNGRIVWWTEKYTRRGRVIDAIRLLTTGPHGHDSTGLVTDVIPANRGVWVYMNGGCHEVRDVDERGTDT